MSASDLAARVGMSRQSIHAMEAGSYVPNTAVALALARSLGTSVEQLFSLDETDRSVSATLLGEAFEGQPLHIAEVGGRVVAVPSSPAPYYLNAVDAIAGKTGRGASVRAQLLSPAPAAPRVVIAGCDPAVTLINAPLLAAPASSRTALQWLKEGLVHLAGSHLHDNTAALKKVFPKGGVTLISFATWEEGLVVAPGNPKSIRGIEDLVRKNVRFINREPGAAIRATLDAQVKTLGIRLSGSIAYGHLPAAWMVASGAADCCLATRVAAQAFGLTFVPLWTARYDLIARTAAAEDTRELLNALTSAAARRKLERVAAYDTTSMGSVLSW
jgi:putative molybdopterin biosynthesis protein